MQRALTERFLKVMQRALTEFSQGHAESAGLERFLKVMQRAVEPALAPRGSESSVTRPHIHVERWGDGVGEVLAIVLDPRHGSACAV